MGKLERGRERGLIVYHSGRVCDWVVGEAMVDVEWKMEMGRGEGLPKHFACLASSHVRREARRPNIDVEMLTSFQPLYAIR